MKIICISDLHGNLPDNSYDCDVLCICGDITPIHIAPLINDSMLWIKETFIPWCEQLKAKEILLVAGNHDFVFENTQYIDIISVFLNTKITYLENKLITIQGVKFYGTPYCINFNNWAFNRNDDVLKEIFRNIPHNVDFLLTHDAPYGCSDVCLQDLPGVPKTSLGNVSLRNAILEKSPKYNIHGHLHSANHEFETLGNTQVINVSLVDETYKITYEPLIIEYDAPCDIW